MKKLFVGTPMYGGLCNGQYTNSCINLLSLMNQSGIQVTFFFLYDDALVPRARNTIVHEFLKSGFTHLLFIDADIEFKPEDVLSMLMTGKEVIGGPYAKKHINWGKVATVFHERPDIDYHDIPRCVSDYVFHSNEPLTDVSKPLEVNEIGTGFLMIHRNVFLQFKQSYPQLSYKHDNGTEMHCYFPTVIDSHGSVTDGGSDRYLSEDYAFCSLWKKIGGKILLAPWVVLKHIGSYSYTCDFPYIYNSYLKNETSNEKASS